MRLVDLVLRQGHLSEDALTRALVDGERPAHLDRCDICALRALELGRWLDDMRTTAAESADEAFPAERLAAQQAQIMRRLAQIDEPPRVIAFPNANTQPARESTGRRVAPAWVGVAAAAGLVVGVVGGQMAARLEQPVPTASEAVASVAPVATPATAANAPQSEAAVSPATVPASILDMELDRLTPRELQGIDDITPRLIQTSYTIAQRY